MNMEEMVTTLQMDLAKNFGYDDDVVIESLSLCMEELRKAKMHLPPPPSRDSPIEIPTKPFGLFVPSSVEQFIGRRTLESEDDLLHGGVKGILRVPADGGIATVPTPVAQRFTVRARMSPVDFDDNGTGDGLSSMASYVDHRSSRTSFTADTSDVGSTGTTLSRPPLADTFSDDTLMDDPPTLLTPRPSDYATEISLTRQKIQDYVNRESVGDAPSPMHSSQMSDYDNLPGNMSSIYEKDLEKTLEDLVIENLVAYRPEPMAAMGGASESNGVEPLSALTPTNERSAPNYDFSHTQHSVQRRGHYEAYERTVESMQYRRPMMVKSPTAPPNFTQYQPHSSNGFAVEAEYAASRPRSKKKSSTAESNGPTTTIYL